MGETESKQGEDARLLRLVEVEESMGVLEAWENKHAIAEPVREQPLVDLDTYVGLVALESCAEIPEALRVPATCSLCGHALWTGCVLTLTPEGQTVHGDCPEQSAGPSISEDDADVGDEGDARENSR